MLKLRTKDLFSFLWCFPMGLILCLINHTWCMHYMNTVQFVWNAFVCQLLKSLYDLKYTMYGNGFQKSESKIVFCRTTSIKEIKKSDVIGSERCCVIANHSTRLDWLLMLPLVLENDRLKELRRVFKYTPTRWRPHAPRLSQWECEFFIKT